MERRCSVLFFLLALVCIWEFSRPHVETAAISGIVPIARKFLPALKKGGAIIWKERRTLANFTDFSLRGGDKGLETSFYVDNGLNFAVNLNLGTPPVQHNLTMALNSEFFWAACSPCVDCNVSTNEPRFSPRFLHKRLRIFRTTCLYNVSYSPKYSSAGEMASDIVTMKTPRKTRGNKSLRMSLGCGRESTKLLGILNTSGLVGFAKTNKSFIGQLAEMDYTSKFIYCVPSDTFSGKIVLGNYKISSNSYGTGGTIIDSMFAFSYFTPDSYTPLVQAIQNLNSNLIQVSSNETATLLGNDICYNVSVNGDTPPPQTLTYYFENGTQVEFRTWFLLNDDAENATVCLAVGNSQKVGFSLNVIGTYQQLDVAVEFDLEKQEIGFGTAGCNANRTPIVNTSLFLPSSRKSSQALEANFFLDGALNFAMDLSLGTPPQPLNFTLAVDYGFSWVACSSSCAISCTTASLFQPGLSTSHTKLPCGSPSCSAFSAVSTSCGPSYNTSYGTNFSSAGDLGFLSNGTGGTVIDTTFLSYLTSDFYTQLVQAISTEPECHRDVST
ncbi:hypothetical protein SELMODRAFT_416528 [Selaginella moellendorffii]|uniref:Peptidase A1 domain-containing protein n=1 Tax=Selaginella moellendorffii TaxID=88036 RepID=D8RZK4_SELML|nr:hypothetical protein SELMODRAFT_416528 [Selaginella moellendorffii]